MCRQLREAEPLMPSEPVHDPEARCQAARARESAANRRAPKASIFCLI